MGAHLSHRARAKIVLDRQIGKVRRAKPRRQKLVRLSCARRHRASATTRRNPLALVRMRPPRSRAAVLAKRRRTGPRDDAGAASGSSLANRLPWLERAAAPGFATEYTVAIHPAFDGDPPARAQSRRADYGRRAREPGSRSILDCGLPLRCVGIRKNREDSRIASGSGALPANPRSCPYTTHHRPSTLAKNPCK